MRGSCSELLHPAHFTATTVRVGAFVVGVHTFVKRLAPNGPVLNLDLLIDIHRCQGVKNQYASRAAGEDGMPGASQPFAL